jgi:hypothetical protein
MSLGGASGAGAPHPIPSLRRRCALHCLIGLLIALLAIFAA